MAKNNGARGNRYSGGTNPHSTPRPIQDTNTSSGGERQVRFREVQVELARFTKAYKALGDTSLAKRIVDEALKGFPTVQVTETQNRTSRSIERALQRLGLTHLAEGDPRRKTIGYAKYVLRSITCEAYPHALTLQEEADALRANEELVTV